MFVTESKGFMTNTFNKMDSSPVLRENGFYECEICEKSSLSEIFFRKQCEQCLCYTCVHFHNKFKLLKSHSISNCCKRNLGECNTITTGRPKQCSANSIAESSVYDYADVQENMKVQALSSSENVPVPVKDDTYTNKYFNLSAKACFNDCNVETGVRVKALSSCGNVSGPQIDGVYENDDLKSIDKASLQSETQTRTITTHKNAINMEAVSGYAEVGSTVYEEVDMGEVSIASNKGN